MDLNQTSRPRGSAMAQQQMRAWKPLMRFKDASIFFLVTGIITVAIGEAIFLADQSLVQTIVDYTNCNASCSLLAAPSVVKCRCTIVVTIGKTIPPPVFFYYGMTALYQNHRQLMNSVDMAQLTGKADPPSNSCAPLRQDPVSLRYYAPCGQMANVIFNDSFQMQWANDNVPLPWTNKGIALWSDLKRYSSGNTNWSNTVKPPNWPVAENQKPGISGYADDQELMVWMRPAAFPNWQKLYRILNTTGYYNRGLPLGNYTLNIDYNYPVAVFGGQKFFIISNASWMGGRSFAMAVLFFITGCIEVLAGIVFIPLHYRDLMHKAKQNAYSMKATF